MAIATNAGTRDKVGLLIVGLGGAVASTIALGLERIRGGDDDRRGLPLAALQNAELVAYEDILVAGWDLDSRNLAEAVKRHGVVPEEIEASVRPALAAVTPWQAVGSTAFCRNIDGANRVASNSMLGGVEQIRSDIRNFRNRNRIERVVMLNLASVESWPADTTAFSTLERFEAALLANDPAISPAMLYAYAAIEEGVPYANFTPSLAADIPALTELANKRGVPVAGKDGKTGQTFIKTVIAPALRDRQLHVDGWFSTNILGNNDGLALDDPSSLASKLATKGSVLDDILGYKVDNHVIHIHYYKPRGDDKEAWDNIDVSGFLGQRMQIKVNFLCKDSVLAAPLGIEIARCLDLAHRRGEGGVQSHLGSFFKSPMTPAGQPIEHDFARQQRNLLEWLDGKAVARSNG